MSKQVDERVVSMQFDNAQFEKNVSTTMSTLEKLKQSLNLTGAAKGFEDIGAAAKKVDMTGLSNGVENVGLKFNALYTIADQTLRNITTRAQQAAEQMVKSLTIQPVSTGFNEYELKMGSIQTIMASTGESLDTVNKYLNELNKYSDQTIYSFSDMTTNIGKFTNAGVKLEDAVMAIKGISNEAAVSGANANEASRAMYNFAQALSAGYVKLIDWKSIENANMATVEFKNQLLEAAVAAGTLEKQADGMYKVLSANTQGSTFDQTIDATHYFNDSLNYQWMTTEALVSTLKNYADETTDIGKKAYASAQDVKTFTQMMDTLKETAQSGWAQTWELIVGDFETAKNLWTAVGKVVGDAIDSMSESRNNLLKGALTSNWDRLIEKITEAGIATDDFEESLRNVLEKHGYNVDDLIERYGSLEQAVRNNAQGSTYLKEALAGVNSELLDLSDIQTLLKRGSTGDDVKKIQQALKEAGYQCGEFGENLDGVDGKIGEVTENAIRAFQKANGLEVDGIVGPKTLATLEEANKKTKTLEGGIDDLIDSIDQLGGRELLIDGLKNIFEALKSVLSEVRKAWDKVFDSFESSELYNLIERFHNFTETLTLTLTLNEDTTNKLANTFEGLFTILKVVKDIIVKVVSTGVKLIWNVFKPLAKVALTATSAIGKFVTSAGNTVSKVFGPLGDVISSIVDLIGKLADVVGTTVSDCIGKLSELEIIQTIGEWFSDGAAAISDAISDIASYISSIDVGHITVAFDKIKGFFDSISSWWLSFKNSERGTTIINGIMAPFKSLWEWLTSLELPKFNFDKFIDKLYKFFDYLQVNNFTGVFGGIKGTFEYLKSIFSSKWTNFENTAITKFSDFYLKYGDSIKAGFDKCKKVVAAIAQFVFGTKELSVGDILELAEKFLTVMILVKTLNIVKDISGALDSVADAFENIGSGIKWRAIGAAFLSLGAALTAFAICMKVIESMDAEDASRSMRILLTALSTMAVIVGGLIVLSSKLNGSVNLVAATTSLLAIAVSLGVLVYTLKQIDGTEFKNLKSSFGILLGVLLSMSLALAVIGKTCGGASLKTAAALLTMMTTLKMALDVLDAYAAYDWESVKQAIPKMATALLGLALVLRIATGGIKAGANTGGLALLMLSMVLSLKVLLDVISELGKMPADQANQGIQAVLTVLAGITVMLAMINLTNKGGVLEKGQKSINGFAGLATALLAVAATIAILGSLPIDVLKQGGIAVVVILGLFTAMLSILGKSMSGITGFGKITGMIIGMGVIIAELAIVLHLLKDLDGTDSLSKFGGIALVLVAMAGCLQVMSKTNPQWSAIAKWAVGMGIMAALVGSLAVALHKIQDVNGANAIGQFTAISLILAVMTGCLKTMTRFSPNWSAIGKWTVGMGVMTALVAGLGYVLTKIKDVDGANAVSQFSAISIMLVGMSACLRIIAPIGPMASAAVSALGPLALFAAGLVAFLGVLGGLDKLFKGGFGDVMDRAVDIMTKIGAAIGGFVGGIIGGIGAGITSTLPQMGKDLSDFMSSANVFFAGIKSIDSSMVTSTSYLVAAVGKLCSLGVQNGTANVFTVGRSLPNLGTDLSTFMANASDFFKGLSSVDSDMSTAVKSIAEAIGILADASLTESLTFGDGFASLGEKLVPFGEAMVAFSKTISGKIDTQAVEAAAAAGGVMAELTTKLPKEYGAISGLFKSEPIPLDTFGAQLVLFGKAIVSFSSTVKGKIDSDAVEAAASAASVMAELNTKLPKEYGALSGLFKSEPIPLDTFGAQLVMFGRAMMSFSAIVSKGEINKDAVQAASDAAGIMSELSKNLPIEYGAIAALFKDQPITLDEFGSQLVLFGRAIVSFSNTVQGNVDSSAIESAATAGKIMSEMAKNLPDDPSVFEKWFGSGNKMNMETFGQQMVKFGDAIVSFSESISGSVDGTAIKTAVSVAEDLVELAGNLPDDIDLTVLKTGLTDLGDAMVTFSEAVSGKVDNTTITTLVTAAKTLAQAAEIMPDEVNLAKFTIGLSDFGTAIVSFSAQVSGAVDGGSVTTATNAGKEIAAMLATIPQEIDPTNFIDNLGKLGKALVDFSTSVSGSDDSPGIDNAAMASAQLACQYLGSMLTSLSVYTDLTDFISNAKLLGQAIVDFSNTVDEDAISIEAISSAVTAGTQIGNMMSAFAIYTDITEFVANAKLLAQAIVDFSSKVSAEGAINSEAVTMATSAGTTIAHLLTTVSGYADISAFVTNANSMACAIVKFSTDVSSGIDIASINTACTAANKIKSVLGVLASAPDVSSTIALVGKLGDTIIDFSTAVAEADITGLSEDSAAFKKIVESFGDLSKSGVEAFIENLTNSQEKTVSAVDTFCDAIVGSVEGYKDSFSGAGGDLVAGFASGITQSTWKAKAAAVAMAKAALLAAQATLRINSPSKEFYELGAFSGEGFTSAFADYESDSSKAGSAMAKSALLGLRDAITAAKDLVENGIDAQPTIRPVLDLSGIQADANMITSLFDTNPSVGVMANVGAISRGMAYSQNGSTNDDVINAINGLKDSLNNKTGDTYSIGNITYDDGTEVSNAIKTLVRAARVERRK